MAGKCCRPRQRRGRDKLPVGSAVGAGDDDGAAALPAAATTAARYNRLLTSPRRTLGSVVISLRRGGVLPITIISLKATLNQRNTTLRWRVGFIIL